MKPGEDLGSIPAYAEATRIIAFVQGLEDRFPVEEIPTLYRSLRDAALALGARIAEGYGRDGLDGRGRLSDETRRLARGELYGLRHYAAIAAAQFHLDEKQFGTLEALCAGIERLLR